MHLSLDLYQFRHIKGLVIVGSFYTQLKEMGTSMGTSRLKYRIPSEQVIFWGSLPLAANGA